MTVSRSHISALLPDPTLALRPFLDPLPLHDEWWLTLIPLAFLVSVAYKAVRVRTFRRGVYARQVLMMTVQIVVAMIALAVVQHLFVEVIVPALS